MRGKAPHYRLLFVDAFDSFSNNIVSMLEANLDNVKVTTITIDFQPTADWLSYLTGFQAVVIGPGPGSPLIAADLGCIRDLWRNTKTMNIPILGICLGFQSMCLEQGAALRKLQQPRHGVVHEIVHQNKDIFEGVGSVFATLYNSLSIRLSRSPEEDLSLEEWLDVNPWSLIPLAWVEPVRGEFGSDDGPVLMAARVEKKPIWGLQFHPESCCSNEACIQIIKNWWRVAKGWNRGSSKKRRSTFNNDATIGTFSGRDLMDGNIRNGQSEDLTFSLSSGDAEENMDSKERILSPLIALTANLSDRVRCTNIDISSHKFGSHSQSNKESTTVAVLEICKVPDRKVVVLESGAVNGRFTIISMDSSGSFRLEHNAGERTYRTIGNFGDREWELPQKASIFDMLYEVMIERRMTGGSIDLPFWGGFMGFLGYNMGREKYPGGIREYAEDETFRVVDMALLWVERSIVIDHLTGMLHIQSTCASDDNFLSFWHKRFSLFLQKTPKQVISDLSEDHVNSDQEGVFVSPINAIAQLARITEPDEKTYKARIRECQSYNATGDSYELCLTAETHIEIPKLDCATPFILYRELRHRNPARYAAFLQFGDLNILSASPERFLAWNRDQVFEMRPMKGTVKKSPSMTFEKAKEILETRKEIAENLMIADLIRHDMHSVVGSGNVWVEKLMLVEEHAKVYQMVTVIKGAKPENARSSCDGVQMLEACLAPGSMTGAPKTRSMELLDGIEARNRGVYAGVLGYLDVGGGGDWSVIIRSAFKYEHKDKLGLDGMEKPDVWRVGAGGAVTTLSTVNGEWDEMKAKLDTVLGIFRGEAERDLVENVFEKRDAVERTTSGRGGAGDGWGLM